MPSHYTWKIWSIKNENEKYAISSPSFHWQRETHLSSSLINSPTPASPLTCWKKEKKNKKKDTEMDEKCVILCSFYTKLQRKSITHAISPLVCGKTMNLDKEKGKKSMILSFHLHKHITELNFVQNCRLTEKNSLFLYQPFLIHIFLLSLQIIKRKHDYSFLSNYMNT